MSTFHDDYSFDELDLTVEEADYRHNDKYLISRVIDGTIIPDNGLIFENHKRYYLEDLTVRDYFLENTTPYQLFLNGTVIEESSWGDLLKTVATLLLEQSPEKEKMLFDFRCDWTKSVMFSCENRINFKELKQGLFINVNHTAIHSCWFLQTLLNFFEIDISTVYFLIHRPPAAETATVKMKISNEFKSSFAHYIIEATGKDEQFAETIIKNISTHLNPMLVSISKSYTDLFLFDSTAVMFNYIKKIREIIAKSSYPIPAQKTLNACLDILLSFYKKERY